MSEIEVLKLKNEIELKLRQSEEVRRKSDDFANEVERRWRQIWSAMGPHPWETGAYEDSIVVIKIFHRERQGRLPKGQWGPNGERPGTWTSETLYSYRVGSDHPVAHMIEYGTGVDVNGVGRWFGPDGRPGRPPHWHRTPNTPTPAFHPATKTAAWFHGTMD